MRTKETGRNETGSKETGTKETGAKETVGKDTGGKATGAKAPGAQNSQGKGGKGGMLMREREMDNMLPVDTTAGQNATEGIRRKSYSEVVIEGVRSRARVFVGDSKVRKTDSSLSNGEGGDTDSSLSNGGGGTLTVH